MLDNKTTKLSAAVLAAVVPWLFLGFTTYGEICEKSQYTGDKDCSTYYSALVFFWHIAKFLDDHGGAITALATVVLAIFTWRLWWSTDKLWAEANIASGIAKTAANAAKESADVAVASSMPVLSPRVVAGPLHPLEPFDGTFTAIAHFVFENLGKTPAIVQEVRADLYLVVAETYPTIDSYDDLTHYVNQPWVAGDRIGETAIDAVVECNNQITVTSKEDAELLADANGIFYRRFALVGRVIYDDFFGYRHTRYFCIKMRYMKSGLFQTPRGGPTLNYVEREKIPNPDPYKET